MLEEDTNGGTSVQSVAFKRLTHLGGQVILCDVRDVTPFR